MDWLYRRLENLLDNAIFAGVVAVIFAGWSYLKLLPAPIIALVGITAFAVVLFILRVVLSFLDRRKRTKAVLAEPKEIRRQPQVSDLTQKYADWMTTALNQDSHNLADRLFVHNITIDWKPLLETDSYFVIRYDIHSSSIFNLTMGTTIEGHILYDNEPMERIPEILAPIYLKRGETGHLNLRQWVSDSRMHRIALDGGNEITLNLKDVKISVSAKFPDGSDGPKSTLPIPSWRGRLPTRIELENQ